jgi:photosystem II stability/assembly factor-like uncharacterized protein
MRIALGLLFLSCIVRSAAADATKVTWTSRGTPFGGDMYIVDLMVDGGTVYLSAVPNAAGENKTLTIFRSTDAGKKWAKVVALPNPNINELQHRGPALAVHGKVMLLRTPKGVMRSTDAGKKWKAVTSPAFDAAGGMARLGNDFVTANGKTVLASADGQTWRTLVEAPGELWEVFVAGTRLFAAVKYKGGETLFRRDGETWTDLEKATPGFQGIGMISDNALVETAGEGTHVSLDGGSVWQSSKDDTFEGTLVNLFASTPKMVLLGTEYGVSRSTDGGKSWAPLAMPTAEDLSCRSLTIVASQLLLACTTGKKTSRKLSMFTADVARVASAVVPPPPPAPPAPPAEDYEE